jgi:hypothetical protein
MTSLQKFLMWTPFVGPQIGISRGIIRQMTERKEECLQAWGQYSSDKVELAQKISRIIQDAMEWPNGLFLPDDPFRILLWERYSDGLGIFYAMKGIEEATQVTPDESTWELWLKQRTYGQVLDELLRLKTEKGGTSASA